MRAVAILAFALSGCAFSPQASQDYVAKQSSFDVCRLTMGGPHSQMAQREAGMRGLDCTQFYGAIAAQQANQNAAVANFLNSINPPPRPQTNCQTWRAGATIQTRCW